MDEEYLLKQTQDYRDCVGVSKVFALIFERSTETFIIKQLTKDKLKNIEVMHCNG